MRNGWAPEKDVPVFSPDDVPHARSPRLRRSFLEASGLLGPVRLEVEEIGASSRVAARVWTSDQPFFLIGRESLCDLRLDHPKVSRRHAYVQVIAGRLFAIDLQSRTGLITEGGRAAWAWIGPREGIQVGPYRIRNGNGSDQRAAGAWPDPLDNPLASYPVSHRLLPGLQLAIFGVSTETPTWEMRSVVALIGKSPACRVRLDDSRLSRFHAALVRTPEGPWMVNLQADPEIECNGASVAYAPLAPDDELTIGRYSFRAIRTGAPGREITKLDSSASPPALTQVAEAGPLLHRVEPRVGAGPWQAPQVAHRGPLAAGVQGDLSDHLLGSFQQALQMMSQWFGELYREQAVRFQEELDQLARLNRELAELYGRLEGRPTHASEPAPVGALDPPHDGLSDDPTHDPFGSAVLAAAGPALDADRNPEREQKLHLHVLERIEALQREQQTRWQRMMRMVSGRP